MVKDNKYNFIKTTLFLSVFVFAISWIAHLYLATRELRGFFGDGSLAFLAYLSESYVFGKSGNLVHIFPVGFPRDFQMLLNSIGLQIALWLNVTDPLALKYIFVFWQFFLPGAMYVMLFVVLWKKKLVRWIVFPLISWAVLSIPVEWSAPNSTRWAIPIFWMHFMLVLHAGSAIRKHTLLTAAFLGVAMLGGIYESVMLHCSLCLFLGALLWQRDGNRNPFIYALMSVPGALRAAWSYAESGHIAPNGFSGFTLPYAWNQPGLLFIVFALVAVAVIGMAKMPAKKIWIPLAVLLLPAVNALTFDPPGVWEQINMRFEYVLLSTLLMLWAGVLRLRKSMSHEFAIMASIIACLSGAVLWTSQSLETTGWWMECQAQRTDDIKDSTISILAPYRSLFENKKGITSLPYRKCMWDWAQPWSDMLYAKDGVISSWSILTFWQDFGFVEENGQVYFRTNNWTLNSPSMQKGGADIPLKTLLYDLTPLYKKVGIGELARRQYCLPHQYAGKYWEKHLLAIDDERRRLMHVCPQANEIKGK